MPPSAPTDPVYTREEQAGGTLFYAPSGQPADLVELLHRAGDLTLDGEIACARIALLRILRALEQATSPADPSAPPLAANEVARLANAAFRGAATVARLLRDRKALVGDSSDGIASVIAEALDELSEEWGIEL